MKKYMYNPIMVTFEREGIDFKTTYTGYMLDSWLEMFNMIEDLEANDIVERVQLKRLNDDKYIAYYKENEEGTQDDVFFVRSKDCDKTVSDRDFYNYIMGSIYDTKNCLENLDIE